MALPASRCSRIADALVEPFFCCHAHYTILTRVIASAISVIMVNARHDMFEFFRLFGL